MLAPAEHQHLVDARVRRDPTRTGKLRAKMRAEGDRRWRLLVQTLRQALIEHDLIGLRGMSKLPYGDKTEGFGLWLAEELRQKVLGFDGGWLRPYVQEAANLAQRYATEMATPFVAVDPSRVAAMQSLAVSELRGIVAAAQQQLVRAVAHCLAASATPHRCLASVVGVAKSMRNRTRAMADYIVVKTHATSTLSALRSAGVTHVGTVAERLRPRTKQTAHGRVLLDKRRQIEEGEDVDVVTAGDDDVCTVCEEISDGGPYELDEAEGLIPAHPWCRCAFVPLSDARFANVREFDARWFDRDVSEEPRDPQGRWTFAGGPQGEKWQDVADAAVEQWHKENPRVAAKTVKLRRDIDQAMAEAADFTEYRDWYEQHRPLAKELFGKHEPLFEKFLAAASINSGGAPNVDKAISATSHMLLGGSFASSSDYGGVVPSERIQYQHIEKNEPLTGEKIGPFHEALMGNWDRTPADRHMKNLLFEHPTLSGGNFAQPEVTEAVVGAMARKMGWKPAELQAVLWVVQKARQEKGLAGTVFTYKQYLEDEEARIRSIMHTVTAFQGKDALDAMSPQLQLLSKAADAYRNARLLLTFIEQFQLHPQLLVHDFDPNQARDPRGRWTATGGSAGYEFVSPATGQGGQLPDALAGLKSNRQRILREASEDIDAQLGVTASHTNAVGAWSDGAENSIVTTIKRDADWDKLRVAAAMEGHIADQKAVLVFKQNGGASALYSFHVGESDIAKLHENLLADGLAFHTIAPYSGGARVYVADLDGTAHDAVARAAERYDAGIDYQIGRAEFIGTVKQDGTDREQRDDARRAYEEVIKQSAVPGGQAIWSRVHNHWGQALSVVSDAGPPDEPRDPQGRWTAEPTSFEGSSAAMGEATPTPYTREVDALRDKNIPISWQQRQVLDMWTGGYKGAIHSAEADRLDGLIKQFAMPRDIVLYRRVGWSRWNDKLTAHVGKDFTDPEFMPATLDPGMKLKPGSIMEIHVPKGAAAMPIGSLSNYPEEAEVLFPRKSRMRIESATKMSTGPEDMKFVARLYAS